MVADRAALAAVRCWMYDEPRPCWPCRLGAADGTPRRSHPAGHTATAPRRSTAPSGGARCHSGRVGVDRPRRDLGSTRPTGRAVAARPDRPRDRHRGGRGGAADRDPQLADHGDHGRPDRGDPVLVTGAMSVAYPTKWANPYRPDSAP